MIPIDPNSYPQRVLIVVSGESPQVVTETLFALCTQSSPFIPTRIVVVTTGVGAQRARDTLLRGSNGGGQFFALCEEYGLSGITFGPGDIRVATDASGRQDQDAHTEEELTRMGDLLLATLCEFSLDDTAIHVSLAGGRKTMSFFAGQVMNLVARPQDRLSHVILSDKRFEFSPEFFYPPKVPNLLKLRNRATGKEEEASTAHVEVRISNVPFLRLRELLGKKSLVDVSKPCRLSELIDEANQALAEPGIAKVEFDTYEGKVWCNGRDVPFAPVELGFYYTLAALREDDRGLTRRASDAECLEYLELRSHVTKGGIQTRKRGEYEASVKAAFDSLFGVGSNYFRGHTELSDLDLPADRQQLLKIRADLLNPQFTHVNKRLIESLGPVMSQRFLCQSLGRPAVYYFPEDVEVEWKDRRPRREV